MHFSLQFEYNVLQLVLLFRCEVSTLTMHKPSTVAIFVNLYLRLHIPPPHDNFLLLFLLYFPNTEACNKSRCNANDKRPDIYNNHYLLPRLRLISARMSSASRFLSCASILRFIASELVSYAI